MVQEIDNIIRSAQSLSFYALNKFYLKFGIDPEKIKEIHRPMEFGEIKDDKKAAEYDADKDMIILNYKTVEFIKNALITSKNIEETKNRLIKNIAVTIAHETIHASRTIIKDENTIDNILLTQIEISDILNEEYTLDKKPRRIVACYAIHDDSIDTLEKLTENKNGLSSQIDKYNRQISGQEGLEEILTEALAVMAINNYYYDDISLEMLANTIILNPKAHTDALIGSQILKTLDEETIKSFLSTRFNDNYVDIFKNEFNEDYDELLHLLDLTYKKISSLNHTREEERSLMPKIESILKRKQSIKKEKNNPNM